MLTVIMPMAGLGTRFAVTGETLPKPTIPVFGIEMFCLALRSIRIEVPEIQVVCVLLDENRQGTSTAKLLTAAEPAVQVAMVPRPTSGALETCLAAAGIVRDKDAPVIVLDCDLTFTAPSYFKRMRRIQSGHDDAAGLLLSFRSREPRFSFAEVEGDRVLRTAEKQSISDRALIGAYGFRSSEIFFRTAREILAVNQRPKAGEFYVSTAYNTLLNKGEVVRLEDAENYWSMGTPAELESCLTDPKFLAHVDRLKTMSKHQEQVP